MVCLSILSDISVYIDIYEDLCSAIPIPIPNHCQIFPFTLRTTKELSQKINILNKP